MITAKTLSTAFLGTALGISAAAAQQPALRYANLKATAAFANDKMGTSLYILHTGDLGADRKVFERAQYDAVIGLACEWRIVGSLSMGDGGRAAQVTIEDREFNCAPVEKTGDVPTAWAKAHSNPTSGKQTGLRYSFRQMDKHGDLWVERTDSLNDIGIASRLERIWKPSANQVCLSSSERLTTESNAYLAPYLVNDAGCHPMNKISRTYFDNRLKQMGMTGPL